MTLNKGDKVSVLDDAIDGIVVEVKGSEVTIETTDGFNLTYKSSELIKIESGNAMNFSFNKSQIISEKEVAKPNYINKEKKPKKEIPPPEFDLHIEKYPAPDRASNARYSMPFFLHFRPDFTIEALPGTVPAGEAPKWPPISSHDYLQERLREIKLT